MCTHLTANAVSSPHQISLPKPSTRETEEQTETSGEDRAYYSTPVRLFASKREAEGRSCLFPCRCRSCFRELPLTSTPGASSPLWLCAPTPVRSFFVCLFSLSSLLHILHVVQAWPCRPAPLCTVPMHGRPAELCAIHPLYTALVGSAESSTVAQRLFRSNFWLCGVRWEVQPGLKANCVKPPRLRPRPRRTAISSVIVHLDCAHLSAHFSLPSPSPSFPSPPLPAPEPQPPSLPN